MPSGASSRGRTEPDDRYRARRGQSPDALDAILDAAPLDDEPTTPDEDAGVEEARAEYERGEVFDADRIKRELG